MISWLKKMLTLIYCVSLLINRTLFLVKYVMEAALSLTNRICRNNYIILDTSECRKKKALFSIVATLPLALCVDGQL